MRDLKDFIDKLPGFLSSLTVSGEQLYAKLYAEETQYARLTQAHVNQSGTIHQLVLTLFLSNGRSMVSGVLEGALPSLAYLRDWVQLLRGDLEYVPNDPWLNLSSDPQQRTTGSPDSSNDFEEIVRALCESAGRNDLVGLVLSGQQMLAVCSSLGHCLLHQGGGSSIDVSLFDQSYNAIKRVLSHPDVALVPDLLGAMSQDLLALQQPAVTLRADTYRAWLSAEALGELLGTIRWNGFSENAIQSGSSPLKLLYTGEKSLAASVMLSEDRETLIAPQFTEQGFMLPAEVSLIHTGQRDQTIVSPRDSQEFNKTINSDGMPMALRLRPGTLPDKEVLKTIGTGLYIGHLWYANISDSVTCRLTAMTRYDCFWIENGEVVGPLTPVRIDSSLYQLLGSDLELLGSTLHRIPENQSYGSRAWGGMLLPGAMTALKVTL